MKHLGYAKEAKLSFVLSILIIIRNVKASCDRKETTFHSFASTLLFTCKRELRKLRSGFFERQRQIRKIVYVDTQ